jgi:hypothetical protein
VARALGYDAVYEDYARAWHEIWEVDILVEGNSELQTVIHSTTFYLLGSVRGGPEFNIPMGLSSAEYVGHIFWDFDTFMYPPLFPSNVQRTHWSFEDPATVLGSEEEPLNALRRIRDEIAARISDFGSRTPEGDN